MSAGVYRNCKRVWDSPGAEGIGTWEMPNWCWEPTSGPNVSGWALSLQPLTFWMCQSCEKTLLVCGIIVWQPEPREYDFAFSTNKFLIIQNKHLHFVYSGQSWQWAVSEKPVTQSSRKDSRKGILSFTWSWDAFKFVIIQTIDPSWFHRQLCLLGLSSAWFSTLGRKY